MFLVFVWTSGGMFLDVTFTAQLGRTGQFHTPHWTPGASSWSSEQVWCNCCYHGHRLFTAATYARCQQHLGLALNGFAVRLALWVMPVQMGKSDFIYFDFNQTNPFSQIFAWTHSTHGCHWPKAVVDLGYRQEDESKSQHAFPKNDDK